MKKAFSLFGMIWLLPAALAVFAACVGSPPAAAAGVPLDTAIKEAAARIDERVTAGTKIALLNFNSPADNFSEYVLTELEANLFETGKLTIVDRKEIELIRGEFNFQMSGEVDDDSMQELGRILGAQAIVTGSLTEIGGLYRIVVRVLNQESAALMAQYRNDIAYDKRVQALLASGKAAGGGEAAASGGRPAGKTAARTPAPPAYKVGDAGPAGGIVFYDKGNNSGGWRYMEAAPVNASPDEYYMWMALNLLDKFQSGDGDANRKVGAGKTNADAIMAFANQNGGGFGWAAQICDEISLNGFDDWFLPSVDELQYMYGNLKRRGLGDFEDEWYWCSSYSYTSGIWNNGHILIVIDFATGEEKRMVRESIITTPEIPNRKIARVRAARRF